MDSLTLSKEELHDLTRYRRPALQIKVLALLGIPALLRRDNTVCVLRADVVWRERPEPVRKSAEEEPMLKSTRRKLDAQAAETERLNKLIKEQAIAKRVRNRRPA